MGWILLVSPKDKQRIFLTSFSFLSLEEYHVCAFPRNSRIGYRIPLLFKRNSEGCVLFLTFERLMVFMLVTRTGYYAKAVVSREALMVKHSLWPTFSSVFECYSEFVK